MILSVLYSLFGAAMRLYHPRFRVVGKENIPSEGAFLICANHRGMADPLWIVIALRQHPLPRVMAKAVLLHIPVLGWLLRAIGVIGVRRGESDLNAMKESLSTLKNGRSLLIFPEGTRIKNGKKSEPKAGALMLASRADVPILPVYIETVRRPFSPMRCIIGAPFRVTDGQTKLTMEQRHRKTQELMQTIYQLGEAL